MSMALGIDIGSDKCVVAFVNKSGVVHVLQNEASKREIPVVVRFDKTESLFGSAAAARAIIDPTSTIYQLKRLIGLRFDDPSFQKVRALLPYKTPRAPNGDVLVKVRYMNEDRKFTAVELLGMFLCYLKRMAEKATESTISECVIGIPSYFTDQQRRDYLLAAEVAGLTPLRLFHDGAATALDYGVYRNLPYGEEINVVFVDIGHGDTQVTVVKFCFGAATVLAHSFDRYLGGRDFDDVIYESFAEKFEQQHRLNVRENPKATFRLRTECEKAKKVLSSNSEAQINIECFVGDNDLAGGITRTEFENLSSGLLERIIAACKRALADTDLIKKEIHSVELVGSGSRIPKISDVLRDFFGQETSRTLNGSECIANGCALQCAMLNGSRRAGIFGVHDRMPFSVVGSSACTNPSTSTNMIDKGTFLLSPRVLTLCPSKYVTISYANLNDLPDGVLPKIMCYEVACENAIEKYNLEIRVQFSIHGTIDVKSASIDVKISEVPLGTETQKALEKAKDLELLLIKQDKAIERAKNRRNDLEAYMYQARDQIDVKISEVPLGTETQKALEKAKDLELLLIKQDKAIERAKNRRNDLEAYMYQALGQLSRGVGHLASKSRQECVTNILNKTGAWLDETGTEEPETIYTEKMGELQSAIKELLEEHINISKENEKKAIFITNINEKLDVFASKFKDYIGDSDKGKLHAMRQDMRLFVKGNDTTIHEEEYRKQTGKVDRLLSQIEKRCRAELSRSRQTSTFGWSSIFGRNTVPAAPTKYLNHAVHIAHYSSQTDASQSSLVASCPADGKHTLPGATSVATTDLSPGNQQLTGNVPQRMDDTLPPSDPEQNSYGDIDMPDATDDITTRTNVYLNHAVHIAHYSSQTDASQSSLGASCPADGKHTLPGATSVATTDLSPGNQQLTGNVPQRMDDTLPPSDPEQNSYGDVDMPDATDDDITTRTNVVESNVNQNSQEISSPERGLQRDPSEHNRNGERKPEKMRQGVSYNDDPSGGGKSQPNHPHDGMQTKMKQQSSSKIEDKLTSQHQGYTHLDSRVNPTKLVSMIKKGDYIVIERSPCQVVHVSANKVGNKQGCTIRGKDVITRRFVEQTVPITHCCDLVCFRHCLLYQMSHDGIAIFRADSGVLLGPLKLSNLLIAEIAVKRREGLVLQALLMSWLTEMKIYEYKFVPRR